MQELFGWIRENRLLVDGHCPELRGVELNRYIAAGPVRTDHDLGGLVDYVLCAPERAGLADSWRGWRWAGSCHWPDPELATLTSLTPGLLWLDALTGEG